MTETLVGIAVVVVGAAWVVFKWGVDVRRAEKQADYWESVARKREDESSGDDSKPTDES